MGEVAAEAVELPDDEDVALAQGPLKVPDTGRPLPIESPGSALRQSETPVVRLNLRLERATAADAATRPGSA